MNKTMTPKQIEANRQNAQKATGPKTPSGRAASKMNALKHGIFSRNVLVRGTHARENEREFRALHDRFREHYQPVGPVEEMLVDEIVTGHWRLQRALKAESGEIALNVDGGHEKRGRVSPQLQWARWELRGDVVLAMEESALGNSILAGWLREVRTRVEQDGELTEASIKIPFHGKPNRLSKDLEALRQRLSQNSKGTDAAARREENKAQALEYIDRELQSLDWNKHDCEQREAAEEEARQAAAVLPSSEVLDKIIRYDTMLARRQYRAMNQLERVQRMRLGEAVPPPLTMEVSERP
jgi:hypothetical protein